MHTGGVGIEGVGTRDVGNWAKAFSKTGLLEDGSVNSWEDPAGETLSKGSVTNCSHSVDSMLSATVKVYVWCGASVIKTRRKRVRRRSRLGRWLFTAHQENEAGRVDGEAGTQATWRAGVDEKYIRVDDEKTAGAETFLLTAWAGYLYSWCTTRKDPYAKPIPRAAFGRGAKQLATSRRFRASLVPGGTNSCRARPALALPLPDTANCCQPSHSL